MRWAVGGERRGVRARVLFGVLGGERCGVGGADEGCEVDVGGDVWKLRDAVWWAVRVGGEDGGEQRELKVRGEGGVDEVKSHKTNDGNHYKKKEQKEQ